MLKLIPMSRSNSLLEESMVSWTCTKMAFLFSGPLPTFVFLCAACVSSRPGQSGRCDGYILEGKELEFYQRKLRSKKAK